MKKRLRILPLVLLWLALSLVGAHKAVGQCEAKKFTETTIHRLPQTFGYKEAFDLKKSDLKNGKIEVEYILKKGQLYVIDISNYRGEEKNIILEVYDQNNQLHATNYNPESDNYFPVGYACHETGVHRIVFRFKDTDQKCGVAVLMVR